MFDNGFFGEWVEEVKAEQREDILALVDCALDTDDEPWFLELAKRLERVKPRERKDK